MSHGMPTTIAPPTNTSLGTKLSVCSWIWVTDWKMETIKPTPSAMSSIGAESMRAVMIASRVRSMTS